MRVQAAAALFVLVTTSAARSARAEENPGATTRPSPLWMDLKLASALEIEGEANDAGHEISPDVIDLPDPPEAGGRISVSHGGHSRNRRKFDERRLGVAFLPGWSMLGGEVVSKSFGPGPVGTLRLLINMSTANQFFVDLSYSHHAMRDPKPMFFRTAVTSTSTWSGEMGVICPAFFYAATIPVGGDFRRKSMFMPKLYIGLGPIISQAHGRVTNAGSKGTVTASGSQPFIQFTPGVAFDVRVMEFMFVGADLKYRLTVPTTRPREAKEFSIPRMYSFESALSVSYFFW